jgi:hypothetical protein
MYTAAHIAGSDAHTELPTLTTDQSRVFDWSHNLTLSYVTDIDL